MLHFMKLRSSYADIAEKDCFCFRIQMNSFYLPELVKPGEDLNWHSLQLADVVLPVGHHFLLISRCWMDVSIW